MPSTNEALFDAANRHQVFLLRYGGATARQAVDLLDQMDADLTARINARIERLGPLEKQKHGRGLATTRRLKNLRKQIRQQNREIRQALESLTREQLDALVDAEINIAGGRIKEAVGADLELLRPSPEQLRAAVEGTTMRGNTLGQWFSKWETDRLRSIDGVVRLGFLSGDTTPQIVRNLREQLNISKNSASTLARTSVNAVANQSRDLLYQANDDLVKEVRWVSTLDGRTSAICQARDGKLYPTDSGPRPPAHPNCRSTITPVLKSWDELAKPGALKPGRGSSRIDELFRQNLREQGFEPDEIAQIQRNTRASMNGQVPRGTTYQEWLKRQPAAFQDEVLGPTKGALFRRGGVTLDRFVDIKTGSTKNFTIDKLREKNAEAFMKAGIGESPKPTRAAVQSGRFVSANTVEEAEKAARDLGARVAGVDDAVPRKFNKAARTKKVRIASLNAFNEEMTRLAVMSGRPAAEITRDFVFIPNSTKTGRANVVWRNDPPKRPRQHQGPEFDHAYTAHLQPQSNDIQAFKNWSDKNDGAHWTGVTRTGENNLNYSIRHEYGHILTTRKNEAEFRDAFGAWARNEFPGKEMVLDPKVGRFVHKGYDGGDWLKENVSHYGATNTKEQIAETFAIYTAPNYRRGDFPQWLEDFLDKMLREN